MACTEDHRNQLSTENPVCDASDTSYIISLKAIKALNACDTTGAGAAGRTNVLNDQ